jgi:hypothetical protein
MGAEAVRTRLEIGELGADALLGADGGEDDGGGLCN